MMKKTNYYHIFALARAGIKPDAFVSENVNIKQSEDIWKELRGQTFIVTPVS